MQGSVYLYFGHTLLTQGSLADLARLGIEPEHGLRLSFYDLDADENGRPTYLCAEGTLYQSEDGRWHAAVDEESFRTVLRSDVASY
jgi:hypothetical protein